MSGQLDSDIKTSLKQLVMLSCACRVIDRSSTAIAVFNPSACTLHPAPLKLNRDTAAALTIEYSCYSVVYRRTSGGCR